MNRMWALAFVFYLFLAILFVWAGRRMTESFSTRKGEPTMHTDFEKPIPVVPNPPLLLPAYKYQAGQYESFYRSYPDSDNDGLTDDIDHEPYNAQIH